MLHLRIRRETIGLQNQFGDFFGALEVLQGPLPIRQFQMVIEGPSTRTLFVGGRGAPPAVVTTDGGITRHTFTESDLDALIGESGMPPWLEVARFISVSTYGDWGALGRWYEALIADQLHLNDELRQLVRDLKAEAKDEKDLVRRIYEHVVTSTRYVGIELGIHGWKPYPVAEVYRRRFGDCKDKASLLVALLREAGIEAHVALVRTIQLGVAAADPPSMWAFNHAIAWVKPFDLFLDGTAEQSGLLEIPTMDQGALALIVDGANTTLGIATLRCGETLEPHRHSEPETYYTLAGRGIVTIDGVPHPVAPGTAIYIPGDAEHGIRNDYDEELQILYVFAVSDFNQVVYRF